MFDKLRDLVIIFAAIGGVSFMALAETSTINNTTNQTINSTATNTNQNTNINQSTSTSTNTNWNTNNSTINQTTNSTNTSTSTINNTQNVTSNITQDQNIVNSTTTNNTNNSVVSQTSDSNVVSNNTNNNFSTSSSTVNTNNVNQNNSQNVNQNTNINESNSRQVVTQRIKSPPPSAIAPSVMNYSQIVCATGGSVGMQTQVFGLAVGKTKVDLNCERILLSRELANQGMKVASVALLCQDKRVFLAMESSGTPCPVNGLIGNEAKAYWAANPQERPDYDDMKKKLALHDVKAYKKKDFCKKFPTHELCSG